MSVAVITGSSGLVGSEAAEFFSGQGLDVVGVDNDLRREFFGDAASTAWRRAELERRLGRRFCHVAADIRDREAMEALFRDHGGAVALVVHAAAQPSHDWAAGNPHTDFSVNATGTLNLLEATRKFAPDAVFVLLSTNKVYGDRPNGLPLLELETRLEIPRDHAFYEGITEEMSIDQTLHSLFGVSKVAADLLVQEYGRYFDLRTSCLRCGCLTGPGHSGAELHGFLAYLMECTVTGGAYTVFGYEGKQVRDNLHSRDVASAIDCILRAPRIAEVYNLGGGRESNCSMLEAIELCESISGRKLRWTYQDTNRIGDHRWWISGLSKFKGHYPEFRVSRDVPAILTEIHDANRERWESDRT